MKRISALVGLVIVSMISACTEQEPPKPAPAPPKPAPVVEAPKPAPDAGATDARKLTMMEKHAIWKAQKEADEKLAKELAEQEAVRLRTFDKGKLAAHLKLFAFEKKARKDLDDAAEGLKGKPDAAAGIEKVAAKLRKPIEAQAALLRKMDPTGGNSNVGTDHDVSLNMLANDYPAALAAAAGGDEAPLAEARKELDKRFTKMETYLGELKTWKAPKPEKPAKAAKATKATKKGKK